MIIEIQSERTGLSPCYRQCEYDVAERSIGGTAARRQILERKGQHIGRPVDPSPAKIDLPHDGAVAQKHAEFLTRTEPQFNRRAPQNASREISNLLGIAPNSSLSLDPNGRGPGGLQGRNYFFSGAACVFEVGASRFNCIAAWVNVSEVLPAPVRTARISWARLNAWPAC